MKLLKYSIIFILLSFLLSGCNNNETKKGENEKNIDISRTSITKESTENTDNNTNNDEIDNVSIEHKETEISTFSTPLKSGAPSRITNIKLTCNKINEHILKPGESFSFNQLVGPCTAEEGYKKAEIYVNKKIVFALGGGNCQVSTTLYNAVIAVPGLDVTERHEHNGRSVDYIEDGKDATVSYNTKDLKFTNNTSNDIKLYTWCDDVNVLAKITKIE